MMDAAELLRAHDEDLRTSSELAGATDVHRIGPLWLGRYGTRGFVTYRDLDGAEGVAVDDLIGAAVAHFAAVADVETFEWKTRGHDAPADLATHLARAGLVAADPETVMVGDASRLAADLRPPEGTLLRRAGDGSDLAADVAAVGALHREVFGPDSPDLEAQLLAQLCEADPAVELWLAEARGHRGLRGTARRCPQYPVRGPVRRGDQGGPAPPRHLPRTDRGAGGIGPGPRCEPGVRGVHRVEPADPGALRARCGHDHDTLDLAARWMRLQSRSSSGRCWQAPGALPASRAFTMAEPAPPSEK